MAAMMYRDKKMVIEMKSRYYAEQLSRLKRVFIFFFSAPFDDTVQIIIDSKFHDRLELQLYLFRYRATFKRKKIVIDKYYYKRHARSYGSV